MYILIEDTKKDILTSSEILKNLLLKTDILERIGESKYSEDIVKNLIRGLEYTNKKNTKIKKI